MQDQRNVDDGMDAGPEGGDVTFLHGHVPEPGGPLPRGQHDLSPEFVADHQRNRILDATSHVVGEAGYGETTIGAIVARARVSRRTFYAHFESKEHCVLATYGAKAQGLADAVRTAYVGEDEWDRRMAAAMVELMRVLVEYPHVAHLCFLEIRAVGQAAMAPMTDARMMCTDGLRRGISDRPGAFEVDDMAYELGMGGLIAVIRGRLAAGDPEALVREMPDITRALLGPLAGREATEAVVARIGEAPAGRAAHAI